MDVGRCVTMAEAATDGHTRTRAQPLVEVHVLAQHLQLLLLPLQVEALLCLHLLLPHEGLLLL